MKKTNIIIIFLFLIVIFSGCSKEAVNSKINTEIDSSEMDTTNTETPSEIPVYTYDDLQSIFLSISSETTPNEIIETVQKNNICYTQHEYNSMNSNTKKDIVYKLAHSDQVALQKHSDEGDYISITFDENDNLKTVEYYNYSSWLNDNTNIYAAFFDNEINQIRGSAGYWGQYRTSATQTDYLSFETAESVINCIIENTNK